MQAALAIPHLGHQVEGRSLKQWLSCLCQVLLVAAVETSDELFHSLLGQGNVHQSLVNAQHVASFEGEHGFWIEPAIQGFFRQPHAFIGLDFSAGNLMPFFTAMYGFGHVLMTLSFAVWLYFAHQQVFRFVRNVFIITNALAVVLYETLPIAPPRLAGSFQCNGHPFRFADPIFGALAAPGNHAGPPD